MTNQSYGAVVAAVAEEDNDGGFGGGRRSSGKSLSSERIGRALKRCSLTELPITTNDEDITNATGTSFLYHVLSKLMPMMNIVGYLPLVLPALMPDNLELATKIAFGLSVMTMVIQYMWYRVGGSKVPIRILSITFVCSYGIIVFVCNNIIESDLLYKTSWYNTIIYGIICSLLWVATYALHRPFVADFMIDTIDDDADIILSFPIIRHMIYRITLIWIIAFFSMFVVGLIGALLFDTTTSSSSNVDDNNNNDLLFKFLLEPPSSMLSNICLGLAFVVQILYPIYLFHTIEKKCMYYHDEIQQWKSEHSDIELPYGL